MNTMTACDKNEHYALPLYCRSVGHYQIEENKHYCSAGLNNHFVQLNWCVSGIGEIKLFGQTFTIHKNDVFYYLPGEEHEVNAVSKLWDYRWIAFEGPLAAAIMHSYEYPRRIENAGTCPAELFDEIEEILPYANQVLMRHASAVVMEILARAGGEQSPTFRRTQLVEHYLELVNRRFTDASMNVNTLADLLNVHRSTLSRAFTKQMKRSPHNYLISLRAQYGLTLLRGTDLPISEVALRCGLPDKTHFCNIIRRSVGMSPMEYRRSAVPEK